MKHAVCKRFIVATILVATLLEFSCTARADLAAIFTNSAPAHLAVPRRASIILIECDGLGYGDLSCYGQTKYQTPNLDQLAAEGIRFTHFYAGDAASSPARAALLTGLDSGHLPQRADLYVPLSADDVTVAQILKNSGYATGLIGEWILGDESSSGAPWKKGFDEFAGYFNPDDARNVYADYIWRFAPHAIHNETNGGWNNFTGREMIYPNTDGKKGQYLPDTLTKAALNFVKIHVPDQFNHYHPFFLQVNYKIPGDGPAQAPSDAPYSDEAWPQPAKNRAALVSRLDGYVGQLLDGLKKLGMTNNVAIFFTSDTGPQNGTNNVAANFFASAGSFRGGRDELFEGGLRVPLIVRWTGKIPAGQVSELPCAAWDFLPTAAEIAYAQTPTNLDGFSLLPTLRGQTQTNRHQTFFWQLRGYETTEAVIADDWKALQTGTNAPEIYDLKSDPAEKTPVQNPEMATEFNALLKSRE